MNHPLFHKLPFLIYMLAWSITGGMHALFAIKIFDLPPESSLVSALVSNVLGATLGISVWYLHLYFVHKRPLNTALIHSLVLCIIYSTIWAGGSYTLLSTLYSGDEPFLQMLRYSHPWRLIGGVSSYTVLGLSYSLFLSLQDQRESLAKGARLQALLHQSELNLLKSQLNPHFLFNSLNSVSALIELDPPKAQEMIESLAEYLRYSIAAPAHAATTLEEELRNTERYLDIEQIRFGDKMSYSTEVAPDCLHLKVPSMLLQPLYENAIKHGIGECRGSAEILTSAYLEDHYLHLVLRNTLERPSTRKGTGLGLRNVQDRLRLYYGEGKTRLQGQALNNYYEVHMVLPCEMPAQNLSLAPVRSPT